LTGTCPRYAERYAQTSQSTSARIGRRPTGAVSGSQFA